MNTITTYVFRLSDILVESGFRPISNTTRVLGLTLNKYGARCEDFEFPFTIDPYDVNYDEYIQTLFNQYICLNARKEIVVESDNSANDSSNDDIVAFLERLLKWLARTYPYYTQLIKTYAANIDNLMAQVASSDHTKAGTSDMPQTATFAAAPTGDVLSALNEQTNDHKEDYGTPMQRIDEIKRLMENAYERWSRDFEEGFVLY